MRKLSVVVLFLIPLLGGCGASPASRLVAAMDDTAAVAATIKDEATLKENRPKLMQAAEKIKEATAAAYKSDGTTTMTDAEKQQVEAARKKLMDGLQHLAAIPGGAGTIMEVSMKMVPKIKIG